MDYHDRNNIVMSGGGDYSKTIIEEDIEEDETEDAE